MDNKNANKMSISSANLPITVAQSQLANRIVCTINESKLHPVVIMPVIEEIYSLVKNTLKETREKEKIEYEKVISESNNNNESK